MTQPIYCGSIAIDRILTFNGTFSEKIKADKIDVLSLSILMDKLEIANGGTGANLAFDAAQFNLRPVLIGSVGEDGKDYLSSLEKTGIDVSRVNISKVPTASFTVFNDSEGNQVGGFYPGAMLDTESLSLVDLKGEDVVVIVGADDPAAMKKYVRECAENDIRLMYDPGQQTNNLSGEDLLEGVEAAEIVMVNEYELEILATKTGKSSEELKKIPKIFVSTLGEKGSVISVDGEIDAVSTPIAQPDEVKDPTGAGDAFRAGFIYGYVRGWEIEKCAKLGAVAGSFNVEQDGPQIPLDVSKIQDRYQKEFNEKVEIE